MPRLFSFLDAEGHGMEVYFTQSFGIAQLVVAVVLPSGKEFVHELNDVPVKEKQWFHLVVTHHNNPRPWAKSDFKVYLDGKLEAKVALSFPVFKDMVELSRIGTNAEIQSASRRLYRETPFYGQMGAIFVLDDAITPAQVKALHQLGPQYLGTLQHTDDAVLDGLNSHIFLHYNCKATRGKKCFDNTPDKNRDKSLDATITGNLNTCITRDVKDMLHCLGGIQVLLPLFVQLQQPVVPESTGHAVDYSVDTKLLAQIFALLGDMMNKSVTNQKEMLRTKSMAVIGHFLQECSPANLTMDALVIIDDLDNKITLADLNYEVYLYILSDLRHWIYASCDVQRELLSRIFEKLKHTTAMQDIWNVQAVLDAIQTYYWESPVDPHIFGMHPFIHKVTQERVAERPCVSDLAALRTSLWRILRSVMGSGHDISNARMMLNFLATCQDAVLVVECLRTASEMLSDEAFKDQLIELGSLSVFQTLLTSLHDQVRLEALKIFAVIAVAQSLGRGKRRPQDMTIDFIGEPTSRQERVIVYPQ